MNRRLRNLLMICVSVATILTAVLYLVVAFDSTLGITTGFKRYLRDNGSSYLLFFIALLFGGLAVFVISFRNHRGSLKLIALAVVALSSFALVKPEQTRWTANYFEGKRIRERHSVRLQNELNRQSGFTDINLHYSYYPYSKSELLSVSGDVADQSTYDKLVTRIEKADDWDVNWNVTIEGRNLNGFPEYLRISE